MWNWKIYWIKIEKFYVIINATTYIYKVQCINKMDSSKYFFWYNSINKFIYKKNGHICFDLIKKILPKNILVSIIYTGCKQPNLFDLARVKIQFTLQFRLRHIMFHGCPGKIRTTNIRRVLFRGMSRERERILRRSGGACREFSREKLLSREIGGEEKTEEGERGVSREEEEWKSSRGSIERSRDTLRTSWYHPRGFSSETRRRSMGYIPMNRLVYVPQSTMI